MGKYIIVLCLTIAIVLFYKSVERVPLLAEDNTEFARAVVTETSKDNLLTDNREGDSQEVTLFIKSGSHKGETVEGYSLNGYLYGADCKVGTKVIVKLSKYQGGISASVYNYDRETELAVLVLLFLGLMWLVGGKRGFNAVLALVFTFVVIMMFYIPMMYQGCSPFLAAVITALLITVVTHVLIANFEVKSISAMLGTIVGVIAAGVIALIFGKVAHITGYNVDEIENLVYVAQNSKLNIGGMLFSGIIISSLGAVMDVGMSISSSLNEIYRKTPDISGKELFRTGIVIGRDMISTMSNTLILAYVGGSIHLLMIVYAYSYQMHQILNLYSIGIEVMNGVTGSMGILLTVPFTAAITTLLLKKTQY